MYLYVIVCGLIYGKICYSHHMKKQMKGKYAEIYLIAKWKYNMMKKDLDLQIYSFEVCLT